MMCRTLVRVRGRPKVCVPVLADFVIYSKVASIFSGNRLFGYPSMVHATVAIIILSRVVRLHDFLTMGSDASVNPFFGFRLDP